VTPEQGRELGDRSPAVTGHQEVVDQPDVRGSAFDAQPFESRDVGCRRRDPTRVDERDEDELDRADLVGDQAEVLCVQLGHRSVALREA
jgi:hypothetical protein